MKGIIRLLLFILVGSVWIFGGAFVFATIFPDNMVALVLISFVNGTACSSVLSYLYYR